LQATRALSRSYKRNLEARVGIEPTHKGFADPVIRPLSPFYSISDCNPSSILSAFCPPCARPGASAMSAGLDIASIGNAIPVGAISTASPQSFNPSGLSRPEGRPVVLSPVVTRIGSATDECVSLASLNSSIAPTSRVPPMLDATAVVVGQRAFPAIRRSLCKTSSHRAAPHHLDRETNRQVLVQRQEAASPG
jgi:hypothetical protein